MASCSSSLYALRVLRDHGIPANSLRDVHRATVLAKITHCACSWLGLCSANYCARLDAFLRRSKHYGYSADDSPTISELFAAADQSLFERMFRNKSHVLQPLLPEKKMISNRNLRPRQHDRQLMWKSVHINDSLFIIRMLFRDSY